MDRAAADLVGQSGEGGAAHGAQGAAGGRPESAFLDRLDASMYADEAQIIQARIKDLKDRLGEKARDKISAEAAELIRQARKSPKSHTFMADFLKEFSLTEAEGLTLLGLAEALLRIPDAETADDFIAERLRAADWSETASHGSTFRMRASAWGLKMSDAVVGGDEADPGFVKGLVKRMGEPVVRTAVKRAVRMMGDTFVFATDIRQAIAAARKHKEVCSFDMLGEGARTVSDAEASFRRYVEAVEAVGEAAGSAGGGERGDIHARHTVSVKLSAIDPHYDPVKPAAVHDRLYPQLLALARKAADLGVGLTIDAEEAYRLVISLEMFERLCREPELNGWDGLGLAVQAYQKRAAHVIGFVVETLRATGRRGAARLVKGAYWDTEIKRAQQLGVEDFPVFTRKPGTDVSFLACAGLMLDASDVLYSQFATHNAHSALAVRQMARDAKAGAYEFQRLHGMGDPLYDVLKKTDPELRQRVYAPVGGHKDLLPYLMRRLLENGANSSFVSQFHDPKIPAEDLVEDPLDEFAGQPSEGQAAAGAPWRNPSIARPRRLFGDSRANSAGVDVKQKAARAGLLRALEALDRAGPIAAGPIISGKPRTGGGEPVTNPARREQVLGHALSAQSLDLEVSITEAKEAFKEWSALTGSQRARYLDDCANALEAETERFSALAVREAGKTLGDAVAEVREAVDFLRYYAAEARRLFDQPLELPGPAGESNHLSLHGRGVFACISPWNFPLAIFTGQIAAALAAGNTVVAKPAEETPLIAFEAVKLWQEAGLPARVLHLALGPGESVGANLVEDPRIAGVAFTGSVAVAKRIQSALAAKPGPIVPLIAETGGLNAMFADTTALREQLLDDVIRSAFNAAGQRCSALRILFLQDAMADEFMLSLAEAMDELQIGDPANPATDVGPVISAGARRMLEEHVARIEPMCRTVKKLSPGGLWDQGSYFGPVALELPSLDLIEVETFGPVLHIVRYRPSELDALAQQLADKGFGLTLGVHSRLDKFARRIRNQVPAGNFYVNRDMIGAVVGVQPFGGEGLSGTGPKAGGPYTLLRYATERTWTDNTMAKGGDVRLLSLDD